MDAVLNAMTTKTKAIYAKRLKDSDYNNLLQKRSVVEIATYLKNETYYASSLEGINEKALHRGQLEILIRNDLIIRLSSILRYAFGSGSSNLFKAIVIQSEINLILTVIRSLSSNEYETIVAKLPIIIENQICFDLKAISACRSFDDLLNALKNTPYYDIIAKYQKPIMEDFDFVGLEEELNRYYFEIVQDYVKTSFKGEDRDVIENLFNTEVELNNIAKIYRLKKYFNASSSQIRNLITPIYARFSKKDLDEIIDSTDADHILDRLMASSYKPYIKENNFLYIEHTTKSIIFNMNRRQILFSSNPKLVLYAYVSLMGIEIENIIDIIEGVRYRVPSDQIKRTLIY